MNIIDKSITVALIRETDDNPYLDKSDWSWFDYLMGYGLPLSMLYCVIRLIISIAQNGV